MLQKFASPSLLCFYIITFFSLFGCKNAQDNGKIVAPWGEIEQQDTTKTDSIFSTEELIANGEIIAVTISGPDTYYDYHGKKLGTQYMLCEKFAQELGINLRVDVCRDTTEMVRKLHNGEADLIMYVLPNSYLKKNKLAACGVTTDTLKTAWSVAEANTDLSKSLNEWFKPEMLAQVIKEEQWMYSANSTKRHVYSPFLNKAGGVISNYDNLFRKYSPLARWDWRMLAAQCYQESCFDPKARSWAGAIGLMQIMPSTAQHLGLQGSDIYNPEKNIEAAVRYLAELSNLFRGVPSASERRYFVLAAYNGGHHHIKDAQALAKAYGKDHLKWNNVAEYVLKLQQPQYYNHPVVKYGYMRGSETVDYVERIRQRYAQYRGTRYTPQTTSISNSSESDDWEIKPKKARHRNRFKI